MSDIIPDYIGSKLSSFSSEEERSETSSEANDTSKPEQGWNPKMTISGNNKKRNGMVKKGIKKRGAQKKKLPVNPNAFDAKQSPLQVETDFNEAPVVAQNDSPTDLANAETNLADSLKSLPKRKKKTSNKPKKRVKKDSLGATDEKHQEVSSKDSANPIEKDSDNAITSEVKEEVTETKKELESSNVEQAVLEVKPSEKTIQRVHKPEAENATFNQKSSEASDADERRAFVQRIRQETRDYLKRLAEERKERQVAYQAFREKLRSDLTKNRTQ